MNADPIPREELKKAQRQFCRSIAAAIAQAMAYRDMSFTIMAARIGKSEKTVRGWFDELIEGKSKKVGLREVANMATALDCRIKFDLVPVERG